MPTKPKPYSRKKVRQGRSVYPGKDKACHVTGILTPQGKALFEVARSELAVKASREHGIVSDGDTIEFLARDKQIPTISS